MKEPDKIYLNIPKDSPAIYNNDVLEIATWSTKEFADCKNIEYIRKDYLLEWAKEKNARLCGTESDYAEGYLHAMIDLIDKLNEI